MVEGKGRLSNADGGGSGGGACANYPFCQKGGRIIDNQPIDYRLQIYYIKWITEKLVSKT